MNYFGTCVWCFPNSAARFPLLLVCPQRSISPPFNPHFTTGHQVKQARCGPQRVLQHSSAWFLPASAQHCWATSQTVMKPTTIGNQWVQYGPLCIRSPDPCGAVTGWVNCKGKLYVFKFVYLQTKRTCGMCHIFTLLMKWQNVLFRLIICSMAKGCKHGSTLQLMQYALMHTYGSMPFLPAFMPRYLKPTRSVRLLIQYGIISLYI